MKLDQIKYWIKKVYWKDFSTKKLTDINEDCLESIFKHLPPEDLLNVAEASKEFQSAVNMVYRRQYSQKTADVELSICRYVRKKPLAEKINRIRINDLETSLKLLRSFGYMINELFVDCNENIKNCEAMFSYINKYCFQNLIELSICNIIPENRLSINMFENPFLNLETLLFYNVPLYGEITQFNRLYPKMKTLIFMEDTILIDSRCIEINFTSLECLDLCNSIPNESIEMLFKLNPQLKTIHFYSDWDGRLLEVASECIPNLELLGVKWVIGEDGNILQDFKMLTKLNADEIYFKNLKTLYVYLENSLFDDDSNAEDGATIDMPVTFGPITEFHFLSNCFSMGNEIEEFLSRHQTITHLFGCAPQFEIDPVLETLPHLQEITFVNAELDFPATIEFMDEYQTIQKIGCFRFNNASNGNFKSDFGSYEFEEAIHTFYETFCMLKRVE